MAESIKLENKIYFDSSCIMYKGKDRQDLKTKIELYSTKQIYNDKTGEPGWGRIAHLPQTGGWNSRDITLLLTPGMGSATGLFGIIYISYFNNRDLQCKIITGNIKSSNLLAIRNSDNSVDIYAYLPDYYVPMRVQLLSIWNTGYEPWNVFDGYGWKQSTKPSDGTQYNFSNI